MLQNVQRCIKITTVPPPQNQERKHRTFVYVLIVTEVLEDWEDSVNIGKAPPCFFKMGTLGAVEEVGG